MTARGNQGLAQAMGELVGVAVPEQERYVSRAELADMMGLHVNSIDRMVRDGMPSETWGLRARRFRPSIAIAWARGRGRVAV